MVNIKLPDHNSKRFATKHEIENAVNNLEKLLDNGPVFMHCHAAVGEITTYKCCIFNEKRRLNYIQAYEYVKQQNKKTNILIEQLKKI